MITHAWLVAPPQGEVDTTLDIVGGLPNLLRQVLSLQDAGIRTITLFGISPSVLRGDRRIRVILAESSDRPAASPAESAAIVARAGAIWHPGVVRRLARSSVAAGEVGAVGTRDAAVYLCGSGSIAATVASLAQSASTVPATWTADPGFVIHPRNNDGRDEALRLLLGTLDKPADGFVSRHLHRPVSKALTRRLLAIPVTPNLMTLVAAAVGVAGVLVAAGGGYWRLLAGAVLFELQNILDGCDGEIARLKYQRSRAGEWLDQIVDDVLNIAFLFAVGNGLSGGDDEHWAFAVAWIALGAQMIHVVGLYAGLIVKAGGRGSVATLRWWVGGGTESDPKARLLGDLTRRDFYSLLYVITAALSIPAVAFLWHSLITMSAALVSTVQWIAWNGPEYHADADGMTDPAGKGAA